MENIYEQVLKKLEREEENRKLEIRRSISNIQISEVICPQELFNLLEYSNDPEFIQVNQIRRCIIGQKLYLKYF